MVRHVIDFIDSGLEPSGMALARSYLWSDIGDMVSSIRYEANATCS